jgi:hypothetical protein
MRRERLARGSRLALLVALASFLCAVGKPALGAGSAARVTLPRCSPEGYGLEQAPPRTAQRRKAVVLTAGWITAIERRRSCRLKTTIRLTIKDSGGAAVKAHWNVRAVLKPWSSVVHTWVWRNWCEPGGQGEATVGFSLPSGRSVRLRVSDPPTCVNAGAASTVADLGTGTKYVKLPAERIPPHVLPKSAPPPLPEALIKVKNAWLVSDGYTLVAVYAGSAGNNPSLGRFAIIRQNEIFGIQYPPDLIDVRRAGALTITSAPRGKSREISAQRGRLGFGSANGTKGILGLVGDHVRITSRR